MKSYLSHALLASILLIGYLDYVSGANVSTILLYAIPIIASSWFCGTRKGIAAASLAAGSWLVVNLLLSGQQANELLLSWSAFSRFIIFILLAYSVSLQVELRKALEREKLKARSDHLTGLLNKLALNEKVEEELDRARRYQHPFSIAFMDLDNFKELNDTEGHARGDQLLFQVATTIRGSLRKTDIVGRIGGDEFVIGFPETGPESAGDVVKKLLEEFQGMTTRSGWPVTASIGLISHETVEDETYDSILSKADQLMYAAKGRGKNCFVHQTVGSGNFAVGSGIAEYQVKQQK